MIPLRHAPAHLALLQVMEFERDAGGAVVAVRVGGNRFPRR